MRHLLIFYKYIIVIVHYDMLGSCQDQSTKNYNPMYGPLYMPPVFPTPPSGGRSWWERIKQFWKGVWRNMSEIAVSFTAGMYAGEDLQKQNLLLEMDLKSKRLLGNRGRGVGLGRKEREKLIKFSKTLSEMRQQGNKEMSAIQRELYGRKYRHAEAEKKKFQRRVLRKICKLPPRERYEQLKELFDLLYVPDILYNDVADKNSKALVWVELQKTKKELQEKNLGDACIVDGQGETT